MKQTCTRKLQWCSDHRVMGHENKCAHMHGHNYEAHVVAEAESLDGIGRVIDFSVLKAKIGAWIESAWDHGVIMHEDDAALRAAVEAFNAQRGREDPTFGGTKVFRLPYNPTAENLARYLGEVVCPRVLADTGVTVTKVVVHETPNCYATWTA